MPPNFKRTSVNKLRLPIVLKLVIACCFIQSPAFSQQLDGIGKEKPVQVTGSIDARGIFTQMSGIPSRYPPASFLLTGNVQLRLYGWELPFAFSLSDKNRQFSQPFNQFGASPTYKWATLHVGYRNLHYNPFTLAGYTMLGAGADLRPGKWRIGFMYGRLSKATIVDSLTQSLTPVAYTRNGLAAKLGYGSNKNFAELSFLRASDDSASMKVNRNQYDTTLFPNAFPSQNIVAGLTTHFTITPKLTFESDAAVSLFTRDISSPLALKTGGGHDLQESLSSFIRINGTSEISTALQAALAYKEKNYQLKFQYRRIDPNYKSMGAYFLNTDIENYTFAPSFNLLKNKLRISGSVGLQNDNVDKKKMTTSRRLIGSLHTSAEITSRLGVDAGFSNYSINQRANTTLFNDTLKITQTTNNISFTPRYMVMKENYLHVVLASLNYMQLNDFNTSYMVGQQARTLNSTNAMLSYQLRFNKLETSVGASVNFTTLKSELLTDQNYGITLNGDKRFLKGKLTARTAVSLLQSVREDEKSRLINANLQARWQFIPKHFFSLMGFLVSNNPQEEAALRQRKYTETRTEIGYSYIF